MADISKINAVLLANIAEIDDVLAANIAKVNGLVFSTAPGVQFLLDTYTGAAAAYSTRKLKTGVTVAARIRRSGDDIEADVEFDSNNEISLTSPISNASSGTYTDLADFVDHTGTARDAFIDEWKDQSGSGNHAAQATAGSQPKLYDATTGLITENGKPAVDFSNHTLQTSSSVVTGTSARSVFNVTNHTSIAAARIGLALTSAATGANGSAFNITGECAVRVYGAVVWANDQLSGQTLGSWHFAAGGNAFDIDFYKNGSAATRTGGTDRTIDTASGNLVIGGWTSASFAGTHQEIIIWASDQDTAGNRTGIESDINGYYSIYT